MSFALPRYGTASLADVLPSALAALRVPGSVDSLGLSEPLAGVRRIAVVLVDGLGYHLLPKAATVAPTLADVLGGRLGSLVELTSGFPSTTPTSLVSLGTGVPPGGHGVLGFTLNVPGTRKVINHIHWRDSPDPREWQPVPTQFERAAAAGVRVSVASRPEFAGSGLTVAAYRGAKFRGASDVDALAGQVLAGLGGPAGKSGTGSAGKGGTGLGGPAGEGTTGTALSYGYHPTLDNTGHLYGVDSENWSAAAREVDRLLARLVEGLPSDAALLVTADHGQLDIPANHRFDLDKDRRLRAGVRVVAGEPRVRYLHTRRGASEDVIAAWRSVLGEAARVMSRGEAVAAGWFGPVPEAHLRRVGDVVVACHDTYAVLASRHEPDIVAKLVAYHGSYTPVEMAIPLIVVRGTG